VAVGLIEHKLGIRLTDVEAVTRAAVLQALGSGTADAALLVSPTLTPGGAPVRPIVTFGAERHEAFGGVPAFAELTGNRHDAFTMSLGLFGPQGVSPKGSAAITAAARKAAAAPETVSAAASFGIPLHISDAAVLEEAGRRNRALIKRIGMQPGQR
jgi:tripartite-type tricarboxylate transporter receptor subunit TctC